MPQRDTPHYDTAGGIPRTIDRGLAYLARQQQADGSFLSYSSASIDNFRRLRSWQTVFVPALMLTSLSELTAPAAQSISSRLSDFLLSQKDKNWSFNYWSKQAPEYRKQVYPNDLDDTFCALAGLYRHNPKLIDEAALARIIRLLLATETSVGGPYRTWLASTDSDPVWLDVDVAVNSNVAYFLSLTGQQLPKLDAFIGHAIKNETYTSPYYPSKYAFVYYFARAYQGEQQSGLLRQARKLHAAANSDLNRALCLSARLRLGDNRPELTITVNSLLNAQRRDGSWPAAAFYADPLKQGKPYYNGAAALTTAFMLEALALFQQAQAASPTARRRQIASRHHAADDLSRSVLLTAANEQRKLEPTLRNQLLALLREQAVSSNGPAIIGLARDFNRSLIEPLRPEPTELCTSVGLANLYGWAAYTTYDDFLDDEGKPAALPAANVATRYSLEHFSQAVPNPSFQALVKQTFNVIDGANMWEQAHCRFRVTGNTITIAKLPGYGNRQKLAERSLGHSLPALAVLVAKDMPITSKSFGLIDRALRHYLIVRQLNDDLHDWPEDLTHGHISYVVARLLKELKARPGKQQLATLSQQAQRQFWFHTLPAVCQLMQEHLAKSQQALTNSGLIRPGSMIEQLLDKQASSLADTVAQQQQTKQFLQHYRQAVEL